MKTSGTILPKLGGKKPSELKKEAAKFALQQPDQVLATVRDLQSRESWEERFFAIILLGKVAAEQPAALKILAQCRDKDWRVNEALGMAFDEYCEATGYAEALPDIRHWLRSKSHHQRRAVSEGLRPWTATSALSSLKDPSLRLNFWGL